MTSACYSIRAIVVGLLLVCLAHALCAQQQPLYTNPQAPLQQRVDDLISRMTLEEKVSQLFNQSAPIDRLGVPAYNWWNECLHGVARAGKATVFPQAMALAATFDEPLMLRLGTAISDEARAKHHFFVRHQVRSIYTGLTFWTPNINIFRDPRWGRGQETYGEDPFLTGRMAVNFINGLQGTHPRYLKTVATAKHYAVHSGPEFTRHSDNIFIHDRDLYTTYLPAFRAAVQEGNVQSVMCAYNRFRDKPCCGSDVLMSNILRQDFGFKGYVVSDCGAVTDFYKKENHHVVATPAQAWGWSLAAGTDLNCEESSAFLQNLDSAVRAGVINERDINTSLARLFTARFKLGMFDPEEDNPYTKIPMSVVGSPQHRKLSLEAAGKSLVLLKNNGVLPFRNVKRVALIGPNADNPAILIGNYNGEPVQPVTPLQAFQHVFGKQNVLYSPGGPLVPGVYTNHEVIAANNLFHRANGKRVPGLQAEYFGNVAFEGTPALTRTDKTIDFYWTTSPIHGKVEEAFSVRWTGLLVPERSGTYALKGSATGGELRLTLDGVPADGSLVLEKGKEYALQAELVVASFWWGNTIEPAARLSWVDTSRDYAKEALRMATGADVIVFCGGISPNLEGEEMKLQTDGFAHGDRTHIRLPQVQEELLKGLHATGKPVVYVNFSGGAVALNWQQENLAAIVQGFYPGETTGTALVNVLLGNINPSGRLPVTFYRSVDDLPAFSDYRMEGRTYRYFKGEALYEFGFGLSYTAFRYNDLHAPAIAKTGETVDISVNVTNAGTMDGEEVVQVYLSHQDANLPLPRRSLVAFKRIFLKRGQTERVSFTITPQQLAVWDLDLKPVLLPGRVMLSVGGRQPGDVSLSDGTSTQTSINLLGEKIPARL